MSEKNGVRKTKEYHLIFQLFRVNLTTLIGDKDVYAFGYELQLTSIMECGAVLVHVLYTEACVRALALRICESLLAPTTYTALLARHRLLLTACTKLPTKHHRRRRRHHGNFERQSR